MKTIYANLGSFDGKFDVDSPSERSFDLVFKDQACEAKCVKCLRAGV